MSDKGFTLIKFTKTLLSNILDIVQAFQQTPYELVSKHKFYNIFGST